MELIPILLFIVPSWFVSLFYYFFVMQPRVDSAELQVLNGNLQKIGMYWSLSQSDFCEMSEGAVQADKAQAHRHFWIMTSLLSLLSILGMLLLIAIFLSGHPRIEVKTFDSRLAKDSAMRADEVRALVHQIKEFV